MYKPTRVYHSDAFGYPLNSSFFLKLVQCQSRLNPEIQPFVVEEIGFTHN